MNVSDFLILLVGDDPGQLSLTQRAFAKANLVNPLRSVSGGEQARAYLSGKEPYHDRRENPLPSLILLDVDLTGSGWLETLAWIRQQPRLQSISVAIVAESLSPQDRQRAVRLGVSTCLDKPLETEGLLQMMVSSGMYWLILRRKPESEPRVRPAAEPPCEETVPRRQGRQDTEILGHQIRFQKTSWELVKSAEDSRGMDTLIRAYWKPLYYFIRQKGFDNETAKDVVQDFLADALERGTISRADPSRGKFRTFLLTALCNFIRDWHKSSNRLKRGGGQVTLSLDFDAGERQYAFEVASGETPETILNRAWLQSVLEQCIAELTGNPTHLQAFRLMIQGFSYSAIAKETGLSESAVKAAVCRLRQQLRSIVLRRVHRSGEDANSEGIDFAEIAALLR